MRILVVDPDPARAAQVAEGLAGVAALEVRQSAAFDPGEAAAFGPDLVVVSLRLLGELQQDLDKARAELASRKTVERAKALLMQERGLDEDGAYRLLRKLSMDSGRPLGAVAADLLAFAGVLKGGPG